MEAVEKIYFMLLGFGIAGIVGLAIGVLFYVEKSKSSQNAITRIMLGEPNIEKDSIECLKSMLKAEKEKSDFYQNRCEKLTEAIRFKQEKDKITGLISYEEIAEKLKEQCVVNNIDFAKEAKQFKPLVKTDLADLKHFAEWCSALKFSHKKDGIKHYFVDDRKETVSSWYLWDFWLEHK